MFLNVCSCMICTGFLIVSGKMCIIVYFATQIRKLMLTDHQGYGGFHWNPSHASAFETCFDDVFAILEVVF